MKTVQRMGSIPTQNDRPTNEIKIISAKLNNSKLLTQQ